VEVVRSRMVDAAQSLSVAAQPLPLVACQLIPWYRVSQQLPRTERRPDIGTCTHVCAPQPVAFAVAASQRDSKKLSASQAPTHLTGPTFFFFFGLSICLFPNAATGDVGLQCLVYPGCHIARQC
jgi:hypothetical protein